MLRGDDRGTVHAIRELERLVRSRERPLVFWIGAGASKWCNYPLWAELAEGMHSAFLRECPKYDKARGAEAIGQKKFPEFFSLARFSNEALFFRLIEKSLTSQAISPVYARFAESMRGFEPRFIFTTNFDSLLQTALNPVDVIEGNEIERSIVHICSGKSFVCHIHGCSDRLTSLVLTKEDYDKRISDNKYQETLRYIFSKCTVLFLGYGLGDKYIIDALAQSAELSGIIGSGPHFVVSNEEGLRLPSAIRQISYHSKVNVDHRAAIFALEVISPRTTATSGAVFIANASNTQSQGAFRSIYYLAGVYPPGQVNTSQVLTVLADEDQKSIELTVGLGFTNKEIAQTMSTGLQDIITGLVCFDKIACPLGSISSAYRILGSNLFWSLVSESCFQFVWKKTDSAMVFLSKESFVDGSITNIEGARPGEEVPDLGRILREIVLQGTMGKSEYDQRIDALKSHVIYDEKIDSSSVESLVRGVLLHPLIQRSIGMADCIMPSKIPRWLLFPVLRVAHVVETGIITQSFGMAAASIPFGGDVLAGPIFSASSSGDWTQQAANYVVAGEITSTLPIHPAHIEAVIKGILKFRDTQSGIEFRKSVLEHLAVNAGAEFCSSVNAGLQRSLPMTILSKARAGIKAYIPDNSRSLTSVVCGESGASNLRLWRVRSLSIFRKICKDQAVKAYDPCPCGSGEKMRHCCEAALTALW